MWFQAFIEIQLKCLKYIWDGSNNQQTTISIKYFLFQSQLKQQLTKIADFNINIFFYIKI